MTLKLSAKVESAIYLWLAHKPAAAQLAMLEELIAWCDAESAEIESEMDGEK